MRSAVLTYIHLRLLVGGLGFALPLFLMFAVWATGGVQQPSVSEYF